MVKKIEAIIKPYIQNVQQKIQQLLMKTMDVAAGTMFVN